jgi:hypothetical protein
MFICILNLRFDSNGNGEREGPSILVGATVDMSVINQIDGSIITFRDGRTEATNSTNCRKVATFR